MRRKTGSLGDLLTAIAVAADSSIRGGQMASEFAACRVSGIEMRLAVGLFGTAAAGFRVVAPEHAGAPGRPRQYARITIRWHDDESSTDRLRG